MFGQSLLSAFGIACTTDTDQLFTTPTSTTSLATYQLNNATTSIPNNTYPGTASNITYTTGKFGDAAVFNGSSSYITATSPTIGNNDASYSFWVNTATILTYSASQPNYPVFGQVSDSARNPFSIFWYASTVSGKMAFSIWRCFNNEIWYQTSYLTDFAHAFSENTWHHITLTYVASSKTVRCYVDNSEVGSGATLSLLGGGITTGTQMKIGDYNAVTHYNGKLDQVRIFSSALPQSAVTALYNETTTTAQSASVDYQLANPNSIAYYKMSDATDQLGNYNGTATNVNFNTEGKFGFAGAFNGSSSKIDLPNFMPSGNASRSVSMWINTTQTTSATLLQYGGGNTNLLFNLRINDGGAGGGANTIGIGFYANDFNRPATGLMDGNWHHIAATYDGTNARIYIDGVQTGADFATGGVNTTASSGLIGSNGGSFIFNGKIDQVRIYDSALSAANVTTLYKEVECEPAAINALDQFNTVLYTGNGGTQSIDTGFKPDLVWVKARNSSAGQPTLFDSVRGISNFIESNSNAAAFDSSGYGVTAFNSNGFTVSDVSNGGYRVNGASGGAYSGTPPNYVAWNWKAPLANLSTGFNGSSTVGSASRIDLTGSTTLTTRSISLWVNLAGTGAGGNLILDNSDGQNPGVVQYGKWVIQLQYSGSNYFCWDTYVGGSYGICDVNYTFNLNTWYHIVFVAEANNQAVYINGVSQTLQNVSRAGDIGTVTMSTNRLGASWSTQYTHALNGKMGQVRIFNDALTASEVADLYTEPAASNNTLNYPAGAGCIAAYPLQTDAVDLSGNYSGASSNVTFGQPGYLTGNTDGTIPSAVAVNQEAGFSIVSFTGPATNVTATVGHGLSSAPELVITKILNSSVNWYTSIGGITGNDNDYLSLNTTDAVSNNPSFVFGPHSSTTFTTSQAFSGNNPSIAYCFTSIPGYSKIGYYTGTGASGNFQYIGFEPRFVMIKASSHASSWYIVDSARTDDNFLSPNLSNAEYTDAGKINFTSTGFTLTSTSYNNSGYTWIYLAIA